LASVAAIVRVNSRVFEGLNNNLASAFLQSKQIEKNKIDWYRHYGIEKVPETRTEKVQAGSTVLIPHRRLPNGSSVPYEEKWIPVKFGEREIPVHHTEGIAILEDSYFEKKQNERKEEALYLQQLTEYLAFGGDDNLFEFCPDM